MNILHLSATKTWGGGENHIENLCHELGKDPDVANYILCVKNALFHKRLQNTSLQVFTAPLAHKMDPRFLIKLGRVCAKQKIDIVHIHDTTAVTLAVMSDYLFDLPPFIFSKKTSFPIKNRKRTLYKYNYPKIKKVLCVSEATKNVCAENILDSSKLTTIYHGTRLDNKEDGAPFQLRESLKIAPGLKIIGNIGNHIRAKNLETFILTANYLINERKEKNFHFVQIGRFSKRTLLLKKMIEDHHLQEHFSFLNFVPNASGFIKQFDLLMISSQSEGLPQVIYEAFYYKVPVISTKVGGVPEAIEHNKNGLLAEAHNFQELGVHAVALSQNEALQQKFTDLSHQILVEKFNTTTMAAKTLAEYKKISNGEF